MQIQDTVNQAGIKARCRRGLQLARDGKVTKHGDLYVVRGRTGNYTVSLENINGESCQCKDWQRYGFGHTCKHIAACSVVASKDRVVR